MSLNDEAVHSDIVAAMPVPAMAAAIPPTEMNASSSNQNHQSILETGSGMHQMIPTQRKPSPSPYEARDAPKANPPPLPPTAKHPSDIRPPTPRPRMIASSSMTPIMFDMSVDDKELDDSTMAVATSNTRRRKATENVKIEASPSKPQLRQEVHDLRSQLAEQNEGFMIHAAGYRVQFEATAEAYQASAKTSETQKLHKAKPKLLKFINQNWEEHKQLS